MKYWEIPTRKLNTTQSVPNSTSQQERPTRLRPPSRNLLPHAEQIPAILMATFLRPVLNHHLDEIPAPQDMDLRMALGDPIRQLLKATTNSLNLREPLHNRDGTRPNLMKLHVLRPFVE